jgi:hypothetical protein
MNEKEVKDEMRKKHKTKQEKNEKRKKKMMYAKQGNPFHSTGYDRI